MTYIEHSENGTDLKRWGFLTPPVDGADFLAAFDASCLRGACAKNDNIYSVQFISMQSTRRQKFTIPLLFYPKTRSSHPMKGTRTARIQANKAILGAMHMSGMRNTRVHIYLSSGGFTGSLLGTCHSVFLSFLLAFSGAHRFDAV